MPRTPSASPAGGRRRRAAASGGGDVADLLRRVEALVEEVQALRVENAALHEEAEAATQFFARVEAALGGGGGRGARGRAAATASSAVQRSRATASAVDGAMVREVIEALGQPSAAEIAAEIGRRGHDVSGRAVRFIAEHAGASIVVDERGQRRYSV